MEPRELQRLHAHYARMDGDELRVALYHGPDAYVSSKVWKIIVEEGSRRGLTVPTEDELQEHAAAMEAAELASQPPPLPAGWALYLLLSQLVLAFMLMFAVDGLTEWLRASRREERMDDLYFALGVLGVVALAFWARHRQFVALRKRLRDQGESQDAA
jgi:hypothetical protein